MPPISAGDVFLVFDGAVRPPKYKRWVCVCAAEGLFLRINSSSHFRPHVLIEADDNVKCIEYNSYVELRGVLEHDIADLRRSLASGESRFLGKIGLKTAKQLLLHAQSAVTLTGIQKRLISSDLAALIEAAERR